MDLFAADSTHNLLPYDGQVYDFGQVIDVPEWWYQQLLAELPWQHDVVTLFGKTHITNRQIVWMSDKDYHYSGQLKTAVPWTEQLWKLKQQIEVMLTEQGLGTEFNACLLNYYPSGEDGMGYHADNEKELGQQSIIASVSLGATRKFVFKHRHTKDKVELPLTSGQLIVMAGNTQQYWLHSLPKTKKVKEGRINLTFRRIIG